LPYSVKFAAQSIRFVVFPHRAGKPSSSSAATAMRRGWECLAR